MPNAVLHARAYPRGYLARCLLSIAGFLTFQTNAVVFFSWVDTQSGLATNRGLSMRSLEKDFILLGTRIEVDWISPRCDQSPESVPF